MITKSNDERKCEVWILGRMSKDLGWTRSKIKGERDKDQRRMKRRAKKNETRNIQRRKKNDIMNEEEPTKNYRNKAEKCAVEKCRFCWRMRS